METTFLTEALDIHLVTSNDSPEFTHLDYALTHSSVIGFDAEWKPNRHAATFPTVSLLQIVCRVMDSNDLPVFLLDIQSIDLPSVYELLRNVFVSTDVIKLGFRFKQDLVYLSSTFREQGCEPGFDIVEPYIDINAIYHYLQPKPKQLGHRVPKQTKSLATICKEVLDISLSKELQCSDWSQRPLTEEQKTYAASDALCLVHIFNVFQMKIVGEGIPLQMPDLHTTEKVDSMKSCKYMKQVDDTLLSIVRKHGDKILLKDSDRKPKASKKKTKRSGEFQSKPMTTKIVENWQGPPPWDPSVGGDGYAKFLCDVMVEGLAKHLRCVGIDAATPYSKKPETRDLINQAQKEKRVLLTRDAKLLRHEYLIKNQLYRVKSLLKNEQLLEIIETFQLKISEDQLMSRCTKCNGSFIQKPLTTEEAVEASKGFQVIPNCLFNRNIEFWQCMDCNQLYWEGTQYQNAVQKFIDVCKLNE